MSHRQCIECAKWHQTPVKSTQIEEIIEELQLCAECLASDLVPAPIKRVEIESSD